MKRTLGLPLPPSYLVITQPGGGHTGMSAQRCTLKDANKLLRDESIVVYIFKVGKICYHNLMFKYPLSEYYNCLKINDDKEDMVWSLLNVTNSSQPRDFEQYIELVKQDDTTDYIYDVILRSAKR